MLGVAKKHLKPEQMVVIAVGDRSKIESQIAKLKLGTIAYRDADGKEMAAGAGASSSSPGGSN